VVVSALAVVTTKKPPTKPIWVKTLLEIPRTERSYLRVELAKWHDEFPPVVRLLVLVQGREDQWFIPKSRPGIRPGECAAVAAVLLEVAS
jgi:hypothetical protein